jgi:hypothetical protein
MPSSIPAAFLYHLQHACEFTSLLRTCVEVVVFFTLTCKCNSLLHVSVETHPGPQDLSNEGVAPLGEHQLVGEGSEGLGLALWLMVV